MVEKPPSKFQSNYHSTFYFFLLQNTLILSLSQDLQLHSYLNRAILQQNIVLYL